MTDAGRPGVGQTRSQSMADTRRPYRRQPDDPHDAARCAKPCHFRNDPGGVAAPSRQPCLVGPVPGPVRAWPAGRIPADPHRRHCAADRRVGRLRQQHAARRGTGRRTDQCDRWRPGATARIGDEGRWRHRGDGSRGLDGVAGTRGCGRHPGLLQYGRRPGLDRPLRDPASIADHPVCPGNHPHPSRAGARKHGVPGGAFGCAECGVPGDRDRRSPQAFTRRHPGRHDGLWRRRRGGYRHAAEAARAGPRRGESIRGRRRVAPGRHGTGTRRRRASTDRLHRGTRRSRGGARGVPR